MQKKQNSVIMFVEIYCYKGFYMTQPSWFQQQFQKLQQRWDVKSPAQVVIILLVFAATGFSVLYLKKLLLPLLGVGEETTIWIRILVSIFVILPIYQVVLLFYGTIFGQFKFFWAFEKRMFGRIIKLFR